MTPVPPVPALLQVENLHFRHPGSAPLLQGWSARLPAGATLLRGEAGSGKTTLLHLLAGALAPQQGTRVLAGVDCARAPGAYQRQVFWHDPRAAAPALHSATARAWWAAQAARHATWSAAALAEQVQGFGLAPHLDKPMHQLSTGSQRKVLLAAALASGAALTLLDEPLAGLDRPSIDHLQRALCSAARQPGRALVVAHYADLPGVPWAGVIVLPG